MELYNLTLLHKETLTKNVRLLRFATPPGMEFKAGQFMQFLIPTTERKIPRSYSISSTPHDEYLEFCIKILENGIGSTHFEQMQLGEAVEMKGPLVKFVLDAEASAHVFVATGVGIAPIMGILRNALLHQTIAAPMKLLFGVRSEKDIFWNEALHAFAESNSHFSYQLTLSQPEATWHGLTGRVVEHLDDIDVNAHYYLCGSAEMVRDVRGILIAAGVQSAHIHFEIF